MGVVVLVNYIIILGQRIKLFTEKEIIEQHSVLFVSKNLTREVGAINNKNKIIYSFLIVITYKI